jgi:AcrR family transcriptional regulator
MAVRGLRLKRDDRERQVLDTAVRLFSEQGYTSTTLQDIADRIGITKPALYYYFRNKQEILLRLLAQIGYRLLDIAQPLAAADRPADERLAAVLRAHVRTVLEAPELFRVYFAERAEVPRRLLADVETGEHAYIALLENLVRDGLRSGVFSVAESDVPVVVRITLSTCNGVLRWYRSSGRLNTDSLAELVSGIAIRGLMAPPSSGDVARKELSNGRQSARA